MKLKISLVSLLLTFVMVTFAQEGPRTYTETAGFKNSFMHNSAGSNWFIQLGAGVQMLGAEGFDKAFFSTSQLTLAPTFAVGKWFSPWLGFRLKGEGGSLHSFPDAVHSEYEFMQKDMYYAGHFDLMWNMSNYWGKYNAKRVFSFIPYIGIGGYFREKNDDQAAQLAGLFGGAYRSKAMNGITLNGGLLFQFRLSNHVGFHIDLAGSLVDDQFNGIEAQERSLGRYEGVASATAGFTFNLGKTYFETVQPMDYGLINDLNKKINDLRAENDLLSKRPVKCDPCPEVKPAPAAVTENTFVSNVVLFRINSAVVDANQHVGIYNTAQFVKNSGEKIKVVGYADKKTGTAAYNLKLSEQRAKAVAKELTSKYGISSDKIVVEWKGANEQPYGENLWNRVVIMSAQ